MTSEQLMTVPLDWLVANQTQVQFYLFAISFVVVALGEHIAPRRAPQYAADRRWFSNVALLIGGNLLVQLCLPIAGYTFAGLMAQRGWGLLNQVTLPAWLSIPLAILLIDAASYAFHRLFHEVPILWRLHKVHHSDPDMDCATFVRQHPIAVLVEQAMTLGAIALIGAPPLAVLLSFTLSPMHGVFSHGNVVLKPAIDRRLRRMIVTPDMHRVHHSALEEEGRYNFGAVFPWWDQLFRTYRPEPRSGHAAMRVGLLDDTDPDKLTAWKLMWLPFRRKRIDVNR